MRVFLHLCHRRNPGLQRRREPAAVPAGPAAAAAAGRAWAPGVDVRFPDQLATTDQGGSSFTVALLSRPAPRCALPLSSTKPGRAPGPRSALHRGGWQAPQTVTVTGVQDHVAQATSATRSSFAGGERGQGVRRAARPPVFLIHRDSDRAGLRVAAAGAETSDPAALAPAGAWARTSKPTAPVTLQLALSDPSLAALSAASLTFTPAGLGPGADGHRHGKVRPVLIVRATEL